MLDPIRFQPEHLADLRKSGLSDETIEQSGLYSVRPSDVSKITAVSGVISLLAIPYGPTFTRYKVFPTNLKAKTKSGSLRYTQPGGSGVHLYIRGYCLSNDPLIFFPIVFVVTRAIGGEAWTPVQNVRIRTWSRPARSAANSAGYVGVVAISLHAPRRAGDRRGNSRWPSFSTVTASR